MDDDNPWAKDHLEEIMEQIARKVSVKWTAKAPWYGNQQ